MFQGKELMTGQGSFFKKEKQAFFQSMKRQVDDSVFGVWGYLLKPKATLCDCFQDTVLFHDCKNMMTLSSSETGFREEPD